MTTEEQIIARAQDLWEQDPRTGDRPPPSYVELQLHYSVGFVGHPAYWSANCAVRGRRLPGRWKSGRGTSPLSALAALLKAIGG